MPVRNTEYQKCGEMNFDYMRFNKHLFIGVMLSFFGVFIYSANTEFPIGLMVGSFFIFAGVLVLLFVGIGINRYKKPDIEVDENQK